MFLSRNKKNNVYPCKPQLYYIKVGFKGVKIIYICRYVFCDVQNGLHTHSVRSAPLQSLLTKLLPIQECIYRKGVGETMWITQDGLNLHISYTLCGSVNLYHSLG